MSFSILPRKAKALSNLLSSTKLCIRDVAGNVESDPRMDPVTGNDAKDKPVGDAATVGTPAAIVSQGGTGPGLTVGGAATARTWVMLLGKLLNMRLILVFFLLILSRS